MRKISLIIVLLMMCLTVLGSECFSINYPEYTGDYIECDSGWCPLNSHELNTMDTTELVPGATEFWDYAGFWKIPEKAINLKNTKPRILLYSGRATADPRYTALVELGKLPYNNNYSMQVVDGKSYTQYNGTIRYIKSNSTYELWVFKREIPLKFKVIEGKSGMFIYEPVEPLSDGFYVIESGIPGASGHDRLYTKPAGFGSRPRKVITAIPFTIGDVGTGTYTNVKGTAGNKSNNNDALANDSANDTKEQKESSSIEKSVNSIFKGLFKK